MKLFLCHYFVIYAVSLSMDNFFNFSKKQMKNNFPRLILITYEVQPYEYK